MSFLTSLFGFVLAIFLLVFIHEYGHFKAARLLGVRVKRFSIGLGRPLWRRVDRHGTEWAIGWAPVGGYVAMVDSRVEPLAPGEEHQAFDTKPLWARSIIVAAGPLTNLLAAFLLWSALFMIGSMEAKPLLGAPAPGSLADRSGFSALDLARSFDGRPIQSMEELHLLSMRAALDRREASIQVERDGQLIDLRAPFDRLDPARVSDPLRALGLSAFGAAALMPAVVKTVAEGGPADLAGLRSGDRIVSINGAPVDSWSRMAALLQASVDKPAQIEARGRDGASRQLTLTPRVPSGSTDGWAKIGVGFDPSALSPADRARATVRVQRSAPEAFAEAAHRCVSVTVMSFQALRQLISGSGSSESVSGPIGIADQAGKAVTMGPASFLAFLAFLSLSLFIMNILPIPGLDGGHLFQYAIEAALRRPLSAALQQQLAMVGFGLLIGLMAFAVVHDLSKYLR